MIDRELSVAENGVTKSQSSFESPQKKRCSNSHKKIKVYELQKKANTKQKEHKEKHQVCLKKLEKEEEILKMIEERKKTIEKEMENKKLLEETECHLDKQIYHVEYRKSEIQKLFSEERGVVQKYEIEKKGRYENIRRMKKQLKIECDKTEADDSLMNISEDYSDEEYSITSDNFEEVQRNEIRRVQLMRKEV